KISPPPEQISSATSRPRSASGICFSGCHVLRPLVTALGLLAATLAATLGCSQKHRPASVLSFADPRQAALARPVNARLEVSSHHKVNEGEAAAVVDFPGGEFPQIVIRPSVSVWDWSAATALVLPVENREGEAIGLSVAD